MPMRVRSEAFDGDWGFFAKEGNLVDCMRGSEAGREPPATFPSALESLFRNMTADVECDITRVRGKRVWKSLATRKMKSRKVGGRRRSGRRGVKRGAGVVRAHPLGG